DSIVYKVRARDYAGEVVVSQDYRIDISFGVIPDEYSQGFESNINGWIMDGIWEWGQPSGTSPAPYEGNQLAGTILNGNYTANADSWMITPPIDLRDGNLDSATLRFNHWYLTQATLDYGTVLLTNDYGATWTQVGPQYSGTSNQWKEAVVNLGEYIGSNTPVFAAFRFVSNASTHNLGWYVDNVRLVGVDTEAPAVPTNLEAMPNIRGIKLTWSPVMDGDLDHYNIYRSDIAGGEYVKINETLNNIFIDETVEANSEYYYVIASEDFSGNLSQYSNESNAIALGYTALFGTDFENDNGGFTLGVTSGTANDWQWGIPTSGPNAANSGVKLWATNLAGNYTASNDSYIQSPAIVIPENSGAVLTFTHWFDFEGTSTLWDYGQVMVSNNDGATWTNITPVTGGKYGTRLQRWITEELDLSAFDGDTIKLRFFFHSDSSIYYSGWYVDDVYVMGASAEGEDPIPDPEPAPEIAIDPEDKGEKFVAPEANFKINRNAARVNKYKTVSDIEVANTPMARGSGIPLADAVVTVLETGRSVKNDPVTGSYSMRMPMGDYTLRAEAYGFYSEEATVTVAEDLTTKVTFVLEPKPQGSIMGRVIDRYYGNPASNAVIRLVEDSKVAAVVADADGYFTIPNVLVGTYTLKVIADGFDPGEFTVTVNPEEVTQVELGLKRFVGFEDEIIYDDGTGENALVLNSAGYGLAVRFTPEQFGKVTGANVYFWDNSWPAPGGNRIGFTIYSTDANGVPSKVGEPIF
ncbi:carboxypeptidase regulatory-like domain-containing protein, partial [Tissierella sp.]|uniref:carboxypeptidase regulatory-like domain-containing protein n=1 Tax=Tissierella sp. TaxID=41274 RepID=UPI002867676E